MSALEESFIVLTVVNERNTQFERWTEDNGQPQQREEFSELEFNDLNIHLYLTLNYGTASEHLDFDFMVLYNAFVLSWGLTITQNSIHTISDLDRSRLSDTRSTENDRIGADTDPEYRIDASLNKTRWEFFNISYGPKHVICYTFNKLMLNCIRFMILMN